MFTIQENYCIFIKFPYYSTHRAPRRVVRKAKDLFRTGTSGHEKLSRQPQPKPCQKLSNLVEWLRRGGGVVVVVDCGKLNTVENTNKT